MITLAFYKGRGRTLGERIQDAAIRFATRGIYSHCELIGGRAVLGEEALCLSSSGRDGGVRSKRILLKPESWDLVYLDIDAAEPVAFIRAQIGAKYDYVGILLSHVMALGLHRRDRWTCSEICASAIWMTQAQRISPQSLFDIVTWMAGTD
ncbi:MAG: hypothetical protein AAF092_05050 [Pseudomonadota bacterium]